jgi:hypothetical protein
MMIDNTDSTEATLASAYTDTGHELRPRVPDQQCFVAGATRGG